MPEEAQQFRDFDTAKLARVALFSQVGHGKEIGEPIGRGASNETVKA